jgi:hypothetical protein
LIHRVARGPLSARRGSGHCGGQVQGENGRGPVAEGGTRPRGAVIDGPVVDQIKGICRIVEQGLIQMA